MSRVWGGEPAARRLYRTRRARPLFLARVQPFVDPEVTPWPPAFICTRADCGKLTVPIRILPMICPHCQQPAQWRAFELSHDDQTFVHAVETADGSTDDGA